jgi:squalene synthase HpnC
VTLIADAPLDARADRVDRDAEAIMARAATENFPVASRVLPRRVRAHLLAVYGFARLVDEVGDSLTPSAPSAGERLAALDRLEVELDRALTGQAVSSPASISASSSQMDDASSPEGDASPEGEGEHPLFQRLAATVRECGLAREPFARLIEANRVDQRVSRYQTWEQLRAYCALSADPVGELVLGIFAVATPARIALSNSICTALQLTEHCQDVAEDLARGRVYLPQEDLARFGCPESDLAVAHASGPLREVLAFEIARARRLLDDGAPLIAELRGRPRLAVAAFVAGGRAALGAIESAHCDVLAGPPRAGRARRALALAATLRASRHATSLTPAARGPAS